MTFTVFTWIIAVFWVSLFAKMASWMRRRMAFLNYFSLSPFLLLLLLFLFLLLLLFFPLERLFALLFLFPAVGPPLLPVHPHHGVLPLVYRDIGNLLIPAHVGKMAQHPKQEHIIWLIVNTSQ